MAPLKCSPDLLWPQPLQEVCTLWLKYSGLSSAQDKPGQSPEIIFTIVSGAYLLFKKSKFVCGLVQNAGATITVLSLEMSLVSYL